MTRPARPCQRWSFVPFGFAKPAAARQFHDQAQARRHDLLALAFQFRAIGQIGPTGKPRRPAIAPALKPPKMRASSKAARASVGRNHHKPLEVNALRNFDYPEAILFDCDGVLCETERDGHRVTFNMTFQEKGLEGHEWDVDLYGELLKIGGGKERMTHYFNTVKDREPFLSKWPEDTEERRAWIKSLHLRKTDLFLDIVQAGKLPLRPGVARLVKEALDAGAKVAVSIIFSFIFVCVWAIRLMPSCFF